VIDGKPTPYSFIGHAYDDEWPQRRERIKNIADLVIDRATEAYGLPAAALGAVFDGPDDDAHLSVTYTHIGYDIARSGVAVPTPLDPDKLAYAVGEAVHRVLDTVERQYTEDIAARTWLEKHRTDGGAGDAPGEESR